MSPPWPSCQHCGKPRGPSKVKPSANAAVQWRRRRKALMLRRRGLTLREVGRHLNVGTERARQLVAAAERDQRTVQRAQLERTARNLAVVAHLWHFGLDLERLVDTYTPKEPA